MKVLISAFSCAPTSGSEAANGWRVINEVLERKHAVWAIIEQSLHRDLMQDYLADHPMPGFTPCFFELPLRLRAAVGLARWLGPVQVRDALHYHLWQSRLSRVARTLHRRVGFELAHHVTFGRYWSPSGLRKLGLPFIWGPVGAAESAPPSFVAELPARERRYEWLRDTARALASRSPALRDTARAATIGIGVTREACAALRALGVRRVEQLPQSAPTDAELARLGRLAPLPDGPFRAICIGRLVHWKGFHLAIRAFQSFAANDPRAELWIAGDGPFRSELERLAARTEARSRIRFLGRLEHDDGLAALARSHVLIHPALHEAFGNVCWEAMAAGRPVICLDIGGPASQVTEQTGFLAPATTPAEAVAAMASALAALAGDPALLGRLSANAKERVSAEFTMTGLGKALDAIYQEAVELHARTRRPPSSSAAPIPETGLDVFDKPSLSHRGLFHETSTGVTAPAEQPAEVMDAIRACAASRSARGRPPA